jgi:membrane dipeptidase
MELLSLIPLDIACRSWSAFGHKHKSERIGSNSLSRGCSMILRAFLPASALLLILAARGEAAPLHERLLTLDSHLDTPASLARPGWRIEDKHAYDHDFTQVDLPRMKKGGLDGGFWAIYTEQGPLDDAGLNKARDFAIMRGLAIREMVAADPKNFTLALTPAEAAPIAAARKRVVYMSIENAYPLGKDSSLLSTFYAMGVRLLGFAHFKNNQFADSSTDPAGPKWGGLSPAGKELLAEANRLGVMLDASHSSDAVLDDMLKLSKAPIVLSHSGCKAVYDHPRNIDDERLRKFAAAGGVIQINGFGHYLKKLVRNPERDTALQALPDLEGPAISPESYEAVLAERRKIVAEHPAERASFEDVMAHLLHALKVAGVDHVGIGLDWDGGGGVIGLDDVSGLPRITEALLKAGYSEADIAKIWSGNLLRVMAAAQAEGARERAAGG